MKDPVILVDVMNLAFRTHYAAPQLESGSGVPTSVLHGVLRAVGDLQRSVSRKMIFCWDHGIPVPGAPRTRNWRDDRVAKYKANRTCSDPEEKERAISQLPILAKAIDYLGYTSIGISGLEADDVIGVLASGRGDFLIYSTDKDFYQLLSDRVKILIPRKKKEGFDFLTHTDVEKLFEIPISRWSEYLALGGDKSDNIKPVKGMGPKTAVKLIQSGVDLRMRLTQQPAAFVAKYGEAWEAIQNCYFAARLPREWKDPRIDACMKRHGAQNIDVSGVQRWSDAARSAKSFVTLCANHDLFSVLSMRRQFFGS